LQEEDYKPYYLESIQQDNDGLDVLNVRPLYYSDIDFYHEVHIEADRQNLDTLRYQIGGYIYIHLLSSTELEVLEGEFYHECSTDGPWKYRSFEFKTIEKTSKQEWKPQYNELLRDFKKLFNQKVTVYETVRDKVAANYQTIYLQELQTKNTYGLSNEEIDKTHLFDSLYRLFDFNPAWDGLNILIDPAYLTPQTPKDWKIAFLDLEKVFETLKVIDVSKYSTIRDHMIERYRRTFRYQVPNLKYNHKDIDEQKYISFFEHLIKRLKETEAA
jgi:hypothetical protein